MAKAFIPLLLTAFLTSRAVGQNNIDTSYFMALKNKETLKYKINGELVGCKMSLECRSIFVRLYSISFDKQHSRLAISGRVLESGFRDSVGAVGVNIFVAQPVKNKLKRLKEVSAAAVGDASDSTSKKFLKRTGDFAVDFQFSKND